MSHECACSRPIHDTAVVCPHCAFQLDAALAEITEYRGLAYDLDITLSKQANTAPGHGAPQTEEPQTNAPGTLKPNPLPYHGGASHAAGHMKATLVGWARLIHAETGADLPTSDTIAGIAAWMRPRVGWLRYHEAGQEAVDEITDAVADARRVVDRPADRLYAGPCDCGEALYGRMQATYVTCRNTECGSVWDVDERRLWLLRSAEDSLLSMNEIARAVGSISPAALYGYIRRGRLLGRGERLERGRSRPVALYRLGDVLDILAQQAEKASA